MRSWPLLVLAAPAAAEVWSGWVGIAQKTGFGLVSPLPGIWPSLHLDTTITLPVGVEAYAAYALRAWLARENWISDRTRRFAKWSAICSFALGMAGQVAYHLLAQAGAARGRRGPSPPSCPACRSWSWPWGPRSPTCSAPTHTPQRTDRTDRDRRTGRARSPAWSAGTRRDRPRTRAQARRTSGSGPPARTRTVPAAVHGTAGRTRTPALPEIDQARLIASRLTAAGKRVSRRALRSEGIKGSNQALNALARKVNAEIAGSAASVPAADAPAE